MKTCLICADGIKHGEEKEVKKGVFCHSDCVELLDWLQPGNKIRKWHGPTNPNNMLMHIRAVVDGDQFVFRHWLGRKKRWNYRVESFWFFYYAYKLGGLRKMS